MREEHLTTRITIHCYDNTVRKIHVIGLWNISGATSLGRDLEGENFKYASVSVM